MSAKLLAPVRMVIVVGALCGVLALGGAATAGGRPVARAAASCSPGSYPGGGYFTFLRVSHASCSTGRKVERAWYSCRLKHGLRGRCHSRVLGFSCKEHRVAIPTEIDATVTCHKGRATVKHGYQQNL